MNVTFKGDDKIFSDKQRTFFLDVLKKHGFCNSTVFVKDVGKKGDNYVAFVKRLIIEKNDGSKLSIVAKFAPSNEIIRTMMNTSPMFKNEIVMYTEVLPELNKLQKSLKTEEKFKYPMCFGCLDEEPHEMILLEDMNVSGYGIIDRSKPMPNACVKLALSSLAKLHALSYVLKERGLETYNKLKNKLVNIWLLMEKVEGTKEYFQQFEDDVISIIKNKKYHKFIEGSASNLAMIATQRHDTEKDAKNSIIVQGDCWSNNILFKLQHEIPVEAINIDYQISKPGSPAGDLLYLIINCTDYDLRSNHFYEWIDFYYLCLGNFISNFGFNVSSILPREELEAELKANGKLAFALSLMLASALVREGEDAISFNDNEEVASGNFESAVNSMRIIHLKESARNRYIKRVEGAADTLIDLKYL